jgi:hypothetical protein
MSDKIVSISLDVTLLDKKRFIPGKKLNARGVMPQYANLDLKLLDNPKFDNNYIVVERCTKEERAAKVKLPIVGNGKTIIGADGFTKQGERTAPPAKAKQDDEDGSVPF